MRKRILFGLWVGLALLLRPAWAGRPIPEGWGEFLAQFDSCGLPDITTAAYVHVQACWTPRIEDPLPYDWDSSGNAWLVAETRDATNHPVRATVVYQGARIVELIDRETERHRPRPIDDPLAPPAAYDPACNCYWTPGNPALDVKQVLRFLESVEWSQFYHANVEQTGRLGLLALALWQRGDATNATALFSALADRAGGATNVAAAAMNLVADGQYGNLYDEFRKTADWPAYRDGLRTLLARYPEGWRMAPVMQFLLERVEDRLARPAPPPAESAGLAKDDLRQAADMLELRAIRVKRDEYSDPLALWLLPSTWRDRALQPVDPELEIRARGLEAIPFLLKLAKDDALTPADRAEVVVASVYRSDLNMSLLDWAQDESARRKAVQTIFEGLDRPATRGEIALGWLQEMVPEYLQSDYRRKDRDEQIAWMADFYRQNKGKSEDELAVVCLPGEYSFHLEKLSKSHLLARACETSIPALEKFLLADKSWKPEADDRDRNLERNARRDMLVRYAFLRGEEARPLVEKFAGILAQDTNQVALAERLRDFPYGATVADLLATLRPESDDKAIPDRDWLIAKMEVMPLAESLGPVLAFAAAATDAEVRADLAFLLRARAGARPEEKLVAMNHAEEWEALISDDRAIGLTTDVKIVSEQYLALNEHLFGGAWEEIKADAENDWQGGVRGELAALRFMKATGVRGRNWLRARVRQRLAGTPEAELPPFSAAETTPFSASLTELRDRFTAVTNREVAAAVTAELDLGSRAALMALLRENAELNARFLPLANRIEQVTVVGDLGEWQPRLQAWEGRLPAQVLLEDLRRFTEDMVRAGKPVTCKLARKADFGGCELTVETRPVPQPYAKPGDGPWPVVGYGGLVCAPGLYGAAVWRLAPLPADENMRWWALETSDAFDLRNFDQALEKFFDPSIPASEETFAVFQTKGERP